MPRVDQRWLTFVRNHAHAIMACDFYVAVTATFQLLRTPYTARQANAQCVRLIGSMRGGHRRLR